MTTPSGIVADAPALARMLTDAIATPDADAAMLTDRSRGVLLGLAAGNVLGLAAEGAWFTAIDRMYPDGVRDVDPREAHRPMDDDLAQAVDLAESLLAGGGLSGDDLASDFTRRLILWARANGRGMGYTTHEVITELATGNPFPEPARIVYERKGGIAPNGGVMRCAPVGIARRCQPALLVSDSAISCAVTHYAATCQWSCIISNAVIALLINGSAPDLTALLDAASADGCPDLAAVAHRDGIPAAILDAIAAGQPIPANADWLRQDQRLIGHTLLCLQAGLWAAATPLNLEDALIAIVSGGGDTDTNGALAGAVLGARYGATAIPQRWQDCIPERERIAGLADGLAGLGGG